MIIIQASNLNLIIIPASNLHMIIISACNLHMVLLQMSVALDSVSWQSVYPMDYYAYESLGPWTNNNQVHRPARVRKPRSVGIKKVVKQSSEIDKSDQSVADKLEENRLIGVKQLSSQTEEKNQSASKESEDQSVSDITSRADNLCLSSATEGNCCSSGSLSQCCREAEEVKTSR